MNKILFKCHSTMNVQTAPKKKNVPSMEQVLSAKENFHGSTVAMLLSIAFLLLTTSCAEFHWSYIRKHKAEVCASCIVSDSINQSSHSTQKDTAAPPMKANIDLLLKCDSNNNVILNYLSQLFVENGKLNYSLDSNRLLVTFLTDSLRGKIYNKSSSKVIHDQVVNPLNLQLQDSLISYQVRYKKLYQAKEELKTNLEAKVEAVKKWNKRWASGFIFLFLVLGFLVWLRFKK